MFGRDIPRPLDVSELSSHCANDPILFLVDAIEQGLPYELQRLGPPAPGGAPRFALITRARAALHALFQEKITRERAFPCPNCVGSQAGHYRC